MLRSFLITFSFTLYVTHALPMANQAEMSLPADLLRIQCGHVTCDVTYQYCDRSILGIRPVCSLCEGMCSPERVGDDEVSRKHCQHKCPVYWYRQHTSKEGQPTPSALKQSEKPPLPGVSVSTVLLSVITMCVTMSTVLLCAVLWALYSQRRTRKCPHGNKDKRGIVTPRNKGSKSYLNGLNCQESKSFLTSPLSHGMGNGKAQSPVTRKLKDPQEQNEPCATDTLFQATLPDDKTVAPSSDSLSSHLNSSASTNETQAETVELEEFPISNSTNIPEDDVESQGRTNVV